MGSRSLFALPLLVAFALTTGGAIAAPPPATKPAAPAKPSAQPQPAAKTAAPAAKNANAATRANRSASETNVRRTTAGGPTYDDGALGADTPELRALYAAEKELFPPASPAVGTPWPQELPFPIPATEDRPRVHASGLPPAPPPGPPAKAGVYLTPPVSDGPRDMAWLAKLDMPDLPVRWDARVVRYLEFFKDDPRGRATFSIWLKRSGRYRDAIKKALKAKSLPEDLTALAMIESGFEPTARSRVGALGLWQFMPETGKIYGLSQDRWADLRMNQASSTEAAAEFLADLHRRFGSWDLAMAAYNMGYGGVLAAVRRYNTNDYWALSKLEGSLPWETTLYVPKILAVAIVNKNLAAFGYQDVAIEPALEGEEVLVAPGTALAAVAQACGTTAKEVEQLNPELRASRTPPGTEDWKVLVPAGKAQGCSQNLAKIRQTQPALERYVVKFGESIEQIASARRVPVAKVVELNAIAPGEVVRGGTVILLPKAGDAPATDKPADPNAKKEKPVVIVPQDVFVYPDRRRVFYRVQVGDTVREVCSVFKVTPDELRRWNEVDPSARLVEGMTLQVFAPSDVDLASTNVLRESDVRTIVTGTEEFFRHWDDKGRRRIVVSATAGDTLDSIGKKHGVTASMMERINRRGRSEVLSEGERVVVWVPGPSTSPPASDMQATLAKPSSTEPAPTPPLANAPAPEQLPQLP